MKDYDREIIRVLMEAGDRGLKTEKVALHVFNACNSMFNPLDFREVHTYVSRFLIRLSKKPASGVERCVPRGVYRLQSASDADFLSVSFGIPFSEQEENRET